MKGAIASAPMKPDGHAPGHPGIAPTWTSSAKDMVGCTLGPSRVWFTLGFGIVNEVYYPRVDTPQIRDLGFIVAVGRGFWVEVKRLENYTVRLLAPGTPAVEIVHKHDRFQLTLRVTPNPDLDVLAIQLNLTGEPDLTPYVLLSRILARPGMTTSPRSASLPGGACLRRNKVHSLSRLLQWTAPSRMLLELPASVMSARATVGKTSTAIVRLAGITRLRAPAMWRWLLHCRAVAFWL